jgi:hypothetical protein
LALKSGAFEAINKPSGASCAAAIKKIKNKLIKETIFLHIVDLLL